MDEAYSEEAGTLLLCVVSLNMRLELYFLFAMGLNHKNFKIIILLDDSCENRS